jgi:hypothetical protein
MIIIAPTDKYTPFPYDFRVDLMALTSFRSAFFSEEFNSDLSIALISSKRNNNTFTSAGTSLGVSVVVIGFFVEAVD